ncbi:MAG: ATP-binding protein [Methanomethylophilus sp.]
MIDYDYSLIIDEGDEQRTFSPNLPKSIKNIDFITGRNSSGKSTLMNIIAAGMYGNKVSSVNPTLRGDIDSLLNSDHKKLKFDILITNPADPIQLKVTKADNEKKAVLMESTDGGVHFSALSQNEFERKYNLIYDIPDNPRTRIKEISRQLMGVYQAYEDNLQDFDSKLTKLITEVRDASNKKKAGELQEQIDKLTEKQKNNEDVIIPRATERIDTIAHIKALKEFVNSRAEVLKAQKDFDEMKKFVPNANISPVKQQRQYDNARRTVASMALTIDTEIESMCENVLKVAEKKDEPIIRQMQALKFTNPARRLALPESYSAVITAFSSLCSSYSHSCSPQDIQERNMLKQLLDVAIQYKNTTLEMPGFDSLDSFTSVLDEKFREADAKTKKSTTAQATVKDCMNLNESVKDLVKRSMPLFRRR